MKTFENYVLIAIKCGVKNWMCKFWVYITKISLSLYDWLMLYHWLLCLPPSWVFWTSVRKKVPDNGICFIANQGYGLKSLIFTMVGSCKYFMNMWGLFLVFITQSINVNSCPKLMLSNLREILYFPCILNEFEEETIQTGKGRFKKVHTLGRIFTIYYCYLDFCSLNYCHMD